jgi:hypothetical protein
VRCVGKGRKERCTPLTTHVRVALQAWLKEPSRRGASALFPQRARGAAQCRQRPVAPGQACACRPREMPVIDLQAGIAARAEAQRCNGVAAGGRRLLRDRAVARS